MSAAREFAVLLSNPDISDLSHDAVEHAKMLVASTLASAALGSSIPSARIARELAQARGGAPESTLWFGSGPKLPVSDVARANTVMSDAAASDDSDLRSIMHCGTAAVTTALAVAEMRGCSGDEVVASIVIGYEAAGRINDAIPGYQALGFHNSTLQIFAAAVAAGRLLRLDTERLTHAIALAATSTGGLSKAAATSTAREYNAGQAVMNGVQAALAAERGFVAEDRILEMSGGFFTSFGGADPVVAQELLLKDFGRSWDIVTDMAIKLMPGAHDYHTLAEAAAAAVNLGAVAPDEIECITVSRPGMTHLTSPLHPRNLIDMAHSPAYFLAAAAADGAFTWEHATQEKITDPVIHGLIDRIEVRSEPVEDAARFRRGACVTVATTDGRRYEAMVLMPKGTAARGLGWSDVSTKYRSLMPCSGLTGDRLSDSLALIQALDQSPSVRPLTRLLTS